MERTELIAVMDRVAASLRFPMNIDQTLEEITEAAIVVVPGIDHASVSITGKDGTIRTLAPTDEIAVKCDELQYELGEGPCLDALSEDPVVQVDDIRTDLRWPAYGPRAAKQLGIGSQLAFQFRAEPHIRGGVNLYAEQCHQISGETRQLGLLFANLVAAALGWSRQDQTMNEALQTRHVIGQATGILMERYRLDPDRAFSFLLRTSQQSNIKLREVAAGIVADATTKAL